jgi:hypothetical protein
MSKVQRFFRYVWRVNALLILVAAAAATFAVATLLWSELGGSVTRNRVSEAAPPLAGGNVGKDLSLGEVVLVEGTTVLRGDLVVRRSDAGFSSGSGYSETRNILFVESQTNAARWLLPDHNHVITAHSDVAIRTEDRRSGRPVATVALVKQAHTDLAVTEGTLLIFDPSGVRVQTVAEGVREIHTATLDGDGRIILLFERRRKYVLATFDASSLDKKDEHEVAVPPLK